MLDAFRSYFVSTEIQAHDTGVVLETDCECQGADRAKAIVSKADERELEGLEDDWAGNDTESVTRMVILGDALVVDETSLSVLAVVGLARAEVERRGRQLGGLFHQSLRAGRRDARELPMEAHVTGASLLRIEIQRRVR